MRKGRHSCGPDGWRHPVWTVCLVLLVCWARPGLGQDDRTDDSATPEFPNDFSEVVWQIDGAGRAADERRLEALVRDIDARLVQPKSEAENACWQILESTALVELSRYRDARASLGVLANTCPVWEVLNNLAVLETLEGATGRAATLLQEAIRLADGDEKTIPQANRRALQDPVVQPGDSRLPPALLLAGVPAECSRAVAADCATGDLPRDLPSPPPGVIPAPPFPDESPIEEEAVDLTREEPAPPEVSPQPDAATSEAEVRSAIEAWRAAWEALDIEAYVGAYVDPDRVPARRILNIGNKSRIAVQTLDLSVEEAEPRRYLAEFRQTYCGWSDEGGWFGDSVLKELELVPVDGTWKIDREEAGEAGEHTCE